MIIYNDTIEIYCGTVDSPGSTVLNSIKYIQTVHKFPCPCIGEQIAGRDDDGKMYVAEVMWIVHHYSLCTVQVYARHI